MSEIITIENVTQFDEVPLRSEESSEVEYRIKVENFLRLLKQFSKDLMTLVSQLRVFIRFAKDVETSVKNDRNDTINAKNAAFAYKEEAIRAANEAKSVVIPTEATYAKEEIDAMLNTLLTQIVAQQAQISILKGENNG